MMVMMQVDHVPMETALIIITVLSIICWSIRKLMNSGHQYQKANSSVPLPPGPNGLPIVGYMPFLRNDLHRQFTELSHEYGPIIKVWLGRKLYIVVSSPSVVKEMVRDHGTIFANREAGVAFRISTYDLNDILGAPYGPHWRDLRKLFAREMLSNNNLEATYNLRKEEVRKTIKDMYHHSIMGTPVDFYNLVFEMNLNIIVNMICGVGKIQGEMRCKVNAGLLAVLSKMLDLLVKPNVSDFFPVLAWLDIQGIAREMRALLVRFDEIMQLIIDDRINNPLDIAEGRTDFLQILVDLMQQPENKASFGITQLKGILGDILAAGTDTSTSTIEWILSELLRHPKVMDKAQQELNDVVGLSNTVEEFHIPKLEYLDAVIKETMRLHPVAALIPRGASHTCNVSGYTVPKGSMVFLNVWALHRDPLVWENPSEFRPERFLGSGDKWDFLGNNFSFIPFGTGRRICAGVPLGERTVRYVLATFLHSFKWALPEGEVLNMSEDMQSALKKRVPLRVIVAPRLPLPELYE